MKHNYKQFNSTISRARACRWLAFGCGLVTIMGWAHPAPGQDDVRAQLWADYHSHYYKSLQTEWYTDGGLRVLPEDFSWGQAYVRPSLRFHRRKAFDGHVGLGLFYTYNKDKSDQLEVRPWQGLKFRWPILANLTFSHYFRLEERFSFTESSSELALRFRYKLSTRIALKKATDTKFLDQVYLPLSFELFADAGPNIDPLFGSRARFDIGVGKSFNDDWVGEIHFIVQASRSGTDDHLDTAEYILRIQVKRLLAAKDYLKRYKDLPD